MVVEAFGDEKSWRICPEMSVPASHVPGPPVCDAARRRQGSIGEANDWRGELYDAISHDLTRWKQKRDQLIRKAQRAA